MSDDDQTVMTAITTTTTVMELHDVDMGYYYSRQNVLKIVAIQCAWRQYAARRVLGEKRQRREDLLTRMVSMGSGGHHGTATSAPAHILGATTTTRTPSLAAPAEQDPLPPPSSVAFVPSPYAPPFSVKKKVNYGNAWESPYSRYKWTKTKQEQKAEEEMNAQEEEEEEGKGSKTARNFSSPKKKLKAEGVEVFSARLQTKETHEALIQKAHQHKNKELMMMSKQRQRQQQQCDDSDDQANQRDESDGVEHCHHDPHSVLVTTTVREETDSHHTTTKMKVRSSDPLVKALEAKMRERRRRDRYHEGRRLARLQEQQEGEALSLKHKAMEQITQREAEWTRRREAVVKRTEAIEAYEEARLQRIHDMHLKNFNPKILLSDPQWCHRHKPADVLKVMEERKKALMEKIHQEDEEERNQQATTRRRRHSQTQGGGGGSNQDRVGDDGAGGDDGETGFPPLSPQQQRHKMFIEPIDFAEITRHQRKFDQHRAEEAEVRKTMLSSKKPATTVRGTKSSHSRVNNIHNRVSLPLI